MKHFLNIETGLFVAAFGLRLIFLGRYPDSWDAVDFALGVQRYDIFHMQPHFPGYPLFLLPAKLVDMWILQPVVSLSLVSALAGAMMIVMIFKTAQCWVSRPMAVVVALLCMVNPALWLLAVQPMSDSMGMMGIWIVLWLISRSLLLPEGSTQHLKWGLVGAFVFGLVMGVRISYFPFAALFLIPWVRVSYQHGRWMKHFLMLTMAFMAGIILWLIPTAATEGGVLSYFALGTSFAAGHFSDWGGTLFSDGNFLQRGWSWGQLAWASMTGNHRIFGIWIGVGCLGIGLLYARRWMQNRRCADTEKRSLDLVQIGRPACWFFFLGVFPYLTWVFIGQNVDKFRHVAILLPFIVLLVVKLSWNKGKLITLWLVGVFLFSSYAAGLLVVEYAWTKPPVVEMADAIADRYPLETTTVFTWEEERVIEYLYPHARAIRLRKAEDLARHLMVIGNTQHTLVTSKVIEGLEEPDKWLPFLTPVGTYEGNPLLYPGYAKLRLYEIHPEMMIPMMTYGGRR